MQPHSQKMDEMRRELQNPEEFQPNEKFDYKYALIVGNQTYNEKYITLPSLPAVVDDLKNAKHTVKMMNIPQENTFVLQDASYADLDEIIDWLTHRIAVITRVLGS